MLSSPVITPTTPRLRLVRLLPVLAIALLVASACSTATGELARTADLSSGPEAAIPTGDNREQPVTEPDGVDGESGPASSAVYDPAILGPPFAAADLGPTLVAAGDDGVWWSDANGALQLVVESAIAADYDGNGGLVFQRSLDAPIVRRTADALADNPESDVIAAAAEERVRMVGVYLFGEAFEVVYLRTLSDGSVELERADLETGLTTGIATVDRDGISPVRLSIAGGYVTGVYPSGAGSGWASVSLSSGDRLFGTAAEQQGGCEDGQPGCATAVTTSADGTTIYQVIADGEDGRSLVVNSASDFGEVARVDLQRPAGGWHAGRIEVLNDLIVISRTINADGTGSLPAIIVDADSGIITELEHPGDTLIVAPEEASSDN